MREGDIHIVWSAESHRAKVFQMGATGRGAEVFRLELRNRTVRSGFGRWGQCPRGTFLLQSPQARHAPPFGFWFIPLADPSLWGPMRLFGRRGIGIHGGGSGLVDPYAEWQGWVRTEGCLRAQNEPLSRLVLIVREAQRSGRRCWITVGDG